MNHITAGNCSGSTGLTDAARAVIVMEIATQAIPTLDEWGMHHSDAADGSDGGLVQRADSAGMRLWAGAANTRVRGTRPAGALLHSLARAFILGLSGSKGVLDVYKRQGQDHCGYREWRFSCATWRRRRRRETAGRRLPLHLLTKDVLRLRLGQGVPRPGTAATGGSSHARSRRLRPESVTSPPC